MIHRQSRKVKLSKLRRRYQGRMTVWKCRNHPKNVKSKARKPSRERLERPKRSETSLRAATIHTSLSPLVVRLARLVFPVLELALLLLLFPPRLLWSCIVTVTKAISRLPALRNPATSSSLSRSSVRGSMSASTSGTGVCRSLQEQLGSGSDDSVGQSSSRAPVISAEGRKHQDHVKIAEIHSAGHHSEEKFIEAIPTNSDQESELAASISSDMKPTFCVSQLSEERRYSTKDCDIKGLIFITPKPESELLQLEPDVLSSSTFGIPVVSSTAPNNAITVSASEHYAQDSDPQIGLHKNLTSVPQQKSDFEADIMEDLEASYCQAELEEERSFGTEDDSISGVRHITCEQYTADIRYEENNADSFNIQSPWCPASPESERPSKKKVSYSMDAVQKHAAEASRNNDGTDPEPGTSAKADHGHSSIWSSSGGMAHTGSTMKQTPLTSNSSTSETRKTTASGRSYSVDFNKDLREMMKRQLQAKHKKRWSEQDAIRVTKLQDSVCLRCMSSKDENRMSLPEIFLTEILGNTDEEGDTPETSVGGVPTSSLLVESDEEGPSASPHSSQEQL